MGAAKTTMPKQSNNNAEQEARELFTRGVGGAPPHPSPASGSQAREAAWGIGVASSLREQKWQGRINRPLFVACRSLLIQTTQVGGRMS